MIKKAITSTSNIKILVKDIKYSFYIFIDDKSHTKGSTKGTLITNLLH